MSREKERFENLNVHKESKAMVSIICMEYIDELKEQNKKLRCCGNCEHYDPCNYDSDHCINNPIQKFSVEGNEFCDKWMKVK